MADDPNPNPNPADPPANPPTPDPPLLAGKYKTEGELAQGIREVAKKAGMNYEADKPIIGANGQFESVQEAVLGYQALTRIASRKAAAPPVAPPNPNPDPAPDPPATPTSDPSTVQIPDMPSGDDLTINDVVTAVGLDPQALAEKLINGGSLEDPDYAAFGGMKIVTADGKEIPLSKPLINSIIGGQAAEAQLVQQRQQSIRQGCEQLAGGKDQLENLLRSARTFVPGDEIDDINSRLANPKHYKGAMRDLLYFHSEAVKSGKVRQQITGDAPPASRGDVITNPAEYVKVAAAAGRGDAEAKEKLRKHLAAGGSRVA